MSGAKTINEHGRSLDGIRRHGSLPAPRAPYIDDETARAIELDERATDTRRLLVVGAAALVMWSATIVSDVSFARAVLHVSAAPFLFAKAAAALAIALVLTRLSPMFGVPSARGLHLASFLCFVPPACAASALALIHPDVEAASGHAIVAMLVALGAALPMPLRRSIPLTASVSLMFTASFACAALFDDGVRARLFDPGERATLWLIAASHVVAGALVVVGAKLQHDLRRQALTAQHKSRYRLEQLLGEGGMGEVWRAWHPGLGRHVALKMLRNGGNDDLVRRFTREIKATAELVHPHTVRVLDCGLTDDGHWYYTMELLRGRTLAHVVGNEGALAAERAAYLVGHAARALAEAHEKGVVHRDVKPENIFVTTLGGETDFVKVLDFGIARAICDDASITREGMVIGTPRYMAPEQERGCVADARSDVYALGASLYLALTAAPPLPGDTIEQVQGARLRGELVPPSWRNPAVPACLDAIVMRCLRTNPAERYADAGFLADAIFATGLPQKHRPPPPSEVVMTDVVEPVRRPHATRNLALEPSTTSGRSLRAAE
jgi:serine/threonine-protein kinase